MPKFRFIITNLMLLISLIYSQGLLESNYTLGRITGAYNFDNSTVFTSSNGQFLLINKLQVQTGFENYSQVRLSFLNYFNSFKSDYYLTIGLPLIETSFKPAESHRLYFAADFSDLSFYLTNHDASSNTFDNFSASMAWNFLSNDASIKIDEKMYDMAYYFNPLLNAGQISASIPMNYSLAKNYYAYSSLQETNMTLNISPSMNFGIIENLQCNIGSAFYLFQDYPTNTPIWSSFNFRFPKLDNTIGWALTREPYFDYYSEVDYHTNNSFSVSNFFLSKRSVSSFDIIEGNWDKSNSTLLFDKQFLLQNVIIYNTDYDNYHNLTLKESLKFGLFSKLTLGSIYQLHSAKDQFPQHQLVFNVLSSNQSKRVQKPEKVSKFEYNYGRYLKPNEYSIDVSYKIPLGDLANLPYVTNEGLGKTFFNFSYLTLHGLENNPLLCFPGASVFHLNTSYAFRVNDQSLILQNSFHYDFFNKYYVSNYWQEQKHGYYLANHFSFVFPDRFGKTSFSLNYTYFKTNMNLNGINYVVGFDLKAGI